MLINVRPIAATLGLAVATVLSQNNPLMAQSVTATVAEAEVLPPLQLALKEAIDQASGLDEGIAVFYEKRRYLPVWIGSEQRRADLAQAVEQVAEHGISPDLYQLTTAESLLGAGANPADIAAAELGFARAFVNLAQDINTGVLDPGSLYRNNFYAPPVLAADLLLRRAASGSDLLAYIAELEPKSVEYLALQAEKKRLDAIIASGDYGASIPANTLMRPGYTGDRTLLVRQRLRALGYPAVGDSAVYDAELVAMVKSFQTDQRLNDDGVLGPATIGALNASASDRLEQVLINLERHRWINHDLGDRHIRVNIPDFTMAVYDHDVVTFRSKVVVGQAIWDQQTPEFEDEMTHMVINPYWHVPKSIARKEYLPMLQRDPLALARRGLQLINSRGQVLNTEGADFSVFSQSHFPFSIKQPPGSSNALGRVKFMFPNRHNIYLHDTPAKSLFNRERRAYSHGCVRVERPFELAYHLLARQSADPEGEFHSVLKTGRERQVNLEQSIPIYLTYNTAFLGEAGEILYRTDVYGRDKDVMKALRESGAIVMLEG